MPSEEDFRTQRYLELIIDRGPLSNSGSIRNLFDWSGALDIEVKGDIVAKYFNRNNIPPYNEEIDLAVPDGEGDERTATAPNEPNIPSIDMEDFEANASNTWAGPRTAVIDEIQLVAGQPRRLILDDNIFINPPGQWNGQGLRNISRGVWAEGNWEEIQNASGDTVTLEDPVDWAVGDRVTVVPRIPSSPAWNSSQRTYSITVNCNLSGLSVGEVVRNFRGNWNYEDWAVIVGPPIAPPPSFTPNSTTFTIQFDSSITSSPNWQTNDLLGVAKRFEGNNNNQGLWYIKGDVLIDSRNSNARFKKTSLVAEGDIGIKGSRDLSMDAYVEPSILRTFPNLASKFGNILSPDSGKRRFRGLIYTEYGDVLFNDIDGIAIIGNNVTLEGNVELEYDGKYIDPEGFLGALSAISWRER